MNQRINYCFNFDGHEKEINHMLISPSGDMLASASSDNTFKIWD